MLIVAIVLTNQVLVHRAVININKKKINRILRLNSYKSIFKIRCQDNSKAKQRQFSITKRIT